MKTLILPLILIALAFASCNKQGVNNTNAQKKALAALPDTVGTWQETKVHVYEQDATGARLYDTTYLQPFTSYDYLKFAADSITVGEDHYYDLNKTNSPNMPQAIPPTTFKYSVNASGNVYIVKTNSQANPGGFVVADTLSAPAPNQLLLHSVFYANQINGAMQITDSYYVTTRVL